MTTPIRRVLWLHEFGEALSPRVVVVSALAMGLGAVAGLVALGLLKLINFLTWIFFYGRAAWRPVSPVGNHLGAAVVLVPVIGALVVGLMIHFWEPSLKGHGIPEAMQAVLLDHGLVPARVAFLKPIATALAIGTGGPFGAEGPIIQTGAALGSLLAQRLRLSPTERTILLAAGAAAGMSATFLAPLAGILVAIELILFEFRARSFVPVAVASATAAAVAIHFRGTAPMFAMPAYALQGMYELWLFALLGLICGVIGLILTRVLFWLEDRFDGLPLRPVAIWSPVIGALVLGLIGFFYPQVLGTGYDTIRAMLNGAMPASMLLGVSTGKFWALVISLGSGTTGGVFAPSLIVGGGFGGSFAMLWHRLLPALPLAAPGLYALAAMAAVFGAIARAPFTAIIFLFELSQNPHAVLPLLVCVILADATMRLFCAESVMTGKLAKRGLVVRQEFSAPLFLHTRISELMIPLPDPCPALDGAVVVNADATAGTAARAMLRDGSETAFVTDSGGSPVGIVRLADIWALQRHLLDR